MTGSLQIKGDKYYMVINFKSSDGRRRQKWINTNLEVKGSKRKAEQMLREYLTQNDTIVSDGMKFSDWIREWLDDVKNQVDLSTFNGYKNVSEVHVIPYFDMKGYVLPEITWEILQKYFDEKRDRGRSDGMGGLSPASLRHHKNILNQTLKEAVKRKFISSNPCEHVRLPPLEQIEYEFYNSEQVNALLFAIQDEPLHPLVKVTATYGLRRSEVLGLKWDSIDLNANVFAIKHTVVQQKERIEKNKTKNSSSRRSFPIPSDIHKIFTDLSDKENLNRRLFEREYIENDYIFKWDNGRPLEPDFVSSKFSKLLKHYGFPHIRFHELRHSCASILVAQGFNIKDIQEWLGHSNITTTANVYGHLDVSRKRLIADTMAETFSVIR